MRGNSALTVGKLESILLDIFPKKDAEKWDYTGLSVGDPNQKISGIAIALDPTVQAMKEAVEVGANVLITHHPLFLDPPSCFFPHEVSGQNPGSSIYFAIQHGISCMNFHTACDVSLQGLKALPERLNLSFSKPFMPLENSNQKGFGALCFVGKSTHSEKMSINELSSRCVESLNIHPRVWGNSEKMISTVVCCGGSAGFLLKDCLEKGVDCLICGEVKYHDCLDAIHSGLTVIELGHDCSELVLCDVFAQTLIDASVDPNCITIIKQERNWNIF